MYTQNEKMIPYMVRILAQVVQWPRQELETGGATFKFSGGEGLGPPIPTKKYNMYTNIVVFQNRLSKNQQKYAQ